jgi:hypothetical protein
MTKHNRDACGKKRSVSLAHVSLVASKLGSADLLPHSRAALLQNQDEDDAKKGLYNWCVLQWGSRVVPIHSATSTCVCGTPVARACISLHAHARFPGRLAQSQSLAVWHILRLAALACSSCIHVASHLVALLTHLTCPAWHFTCPAGLRRASAC